MEVLGWIAQHWLDLLQSVGIVAGLLCTAATLRTDHRSRRVANLLTVTAPPITNDEELLVLLLNLHLHSAYEAMTAGMTAWEAAGRFHSDIQKGFSCAELVEAGGETEAKRAGKLRLELKTYVMRDYDVTKSRFNK